MPTPEQPAATDSRVENRLLVTPTEAARLLAISPRKLWSLTASGEIPRVKLKRSVRYSVVDLRAFIERNRESEGNAG